MSCPTKTMVKPVMPAGRLVAGEVVCIGKFALVYDEVGFRPECQIKDSDFIFDLIRFRRNS
jgi:hypothetical protein